MALNGTIKGKVEANALGYSGCDPFCSDDQLIAIQLSTGYLTNSNLLPHSHSIICPSALQWIVVFGYYHISCLLRSLQFYQLHVVMVKVGEWFIDQLE